MRPRGRIRDRDVEEVPFPVTPMLDMAFQLLAFFILTFQVPSLETHVDLYLPSVPAALVGDPEGRAKAEPSKSFESDLESELRVRASAEELGRLKDLTLENESLAGPNELRARVAEFRRNSASRPLRVLLIADDALRYEEAARLIAAISAAGATSIRLADPARLPALSTNAKERRP